MTDPIRAEAIARARYPDGSVLATLFLADALHRIADVHEARYAATERTIDLTPPEERPDDYCY